MTDTAYPGLGKAEDLFKSLVWDTLVTAGLAALFAAVPGLAIWPLGPIIRFVIRIFGDKLFDQVRLVVDLQAIAFVNEAHRRDFDRAAVTLKIVGKKFGTDSAEFRKAKEDAKASLSKYVRFGGS